MRELVDQYRMSILMSVGIESQSGSAVNTLCWQMAVTNEERN
jgi:hypothetical protein